MDEWFDVIVVGGGPTGTATAIALARTGRRVALIERSGYEAVRVGETLPPVARVPLTQLGVWDRFIGAGHATSPGIHAAWGQAELYENHFIFSPYGDGWHLNRRRFDAMLAATAAEAGAHVYRHARVHASSQTPAAAWRIGATCRGQHREFRAGFLVDATGRAASLARQLGAKRVPCDRLVAVFSFLAEGLPRGECDHWTLVEATPNGWWYSAFLPDSRGVVAYMTDSDLLPKGRTHLPLYWREQLAQAPHTRARVTGYRWDSALCMTAANSYRLDRVAGENWLAAGDAAMAFDPLSSQGLYHALKSGLRAGRSVEEQADGDGEALERYALQTRKTFEAYLRARAFHYGQEQRWPRAPFWQRRHLEHNTHPGTEPPAATG